MTCTDSRGEQDTAEAKPLKGENTEVRDMFLFNWISAVTECLMKATTDDNNGVEGRV